MVLYDEYFDSRMIRVEKLRKILQKYFVGDWKLKYDM